MLNLPVSMSTICGLIFAKSWAFQAAPKEVVCKSGLLQKVAFQKVVLSLVHVKKAHVFVNIEIGYMKLNFR